MCSHSRQCHSSCCPLYSLMMSGTCLCWAIRVIVSVTCDNFSRGYDFESGDKTLSMNSERVQRATTRNRVQGNADVTLILPSQHGTIPRFECRRSGKYIHSAIIIVNCTFFYHITSAHIAVADEHYFYHRIILSRIAVKGHKMPHFADCYAVL